MKNASQNEALFTVRRSWESLLRARAGYLIAGPRGNTMYYAERAAPELFLLPVFIIFFVAVRIYSDEMGSWLGLLFPLVFVAVLFTGMRKTAFSFFQDRNRLAPLFMAEPPKTMLSIGSRYTLADNRSKEVIGSIARTNKARKFLPYWEVEDAAGGTLLRAVYMPFSFSRNRYKLLEGQGDNMVGYISADFFSRKYSVRFPGSPPDGMDDRLILAVLTLIFDSQGRSNG